MDKFQSRELQQGHSKTVIAETTIVAPDVAEPENNNDLSQNDNEGSVLFKLNYKLLSLFTYEPDSDQFQTVYSITLNKIKDDDIVESDFLHDISREQNKAMELYELLIKNSVTPITLRDVLDDYLAV